MESKPRYRVLIVQPYNIFKILINKFPPLTFRDWSYQENSIKTVNKSGQINYFVEL